LHRVPSAGQSRAADDRSHHDIHGDFGDDSPQTVDAHQQLRFPGQTAPIRLGRCLFIGCDYPLRGELLSLIDQSLATSMGG
jgi:hypothetical protein